MCGIMHNSDGKIGNELKFVNCINGKVPTITITTKFYLALLLKIVPCFNVKDSIYPYSIVVKHWMQAVLAELNVNQHW